MIHRATFQNFKALRDVEVTFDSRLTVLVGPNGSGKTSVLQGIHHLTQLARAQHNLDDLFRATTDYFSVPQAMDRFRLWVVGSRQRNDEWYGIDVLLDHDRLIRLKLTVTTAPRQPERVMATGQWDGTRFILHSLGDRSSPDFSVDRFDASAFITFGADRLAVPTLVKSYPPQLGGDGTGLAATLSHIKNKYPDRFREVEQAFLRLIPTAKQIRFDLERVPSGNDYGQALLVDFRGAEGVPARHLSSGTLYALGLLTVILSPDSPSVVLLDDMDHGLHPKAQMELLRVLRELFDRYPALQVIATSHSLHMLHHLEPNEVRVLNLADDGGVLCRPLTAHPEFDRWKDHMTPGEFWSHVGEDWLRKPAPAGAAS